MSIRAGVFLVFAVGASGAAVFAQSKDTVNNPFAAILQTLGLISKQTATIELQVADQQTGLPAVQKSVLELDAAVADVDARVGKLLGTIGNLADTIRVVEETVSRPPASAATLWVSPYWADAETGGGSTAHIIFPSLVTILNAGEETVRASCHFFDAGGSLLLDRGAAVVIGRGATADCRSFDPSFAIGRGWVVISADRPVLPYGYYQHGNNRDNMQRGKMEFYPVDCDNPNGVEFVCNFFGPDAP
jgi:hypothetical protein